MLKPGVAIGEGDEALECYAKHTAQIEVTIHRYNTTTTKRMMFEGKTRRTCGPMVNVSCAITVQIVRQDRTMEEIVFPVPNICEFLTTESKLRVYYTTERDEQGSKINDFFLRAEDLFNEMNWQKKLRGKNPVFECTGMIGFGTSHPDIHPRKQ